jgi:hypothetical protein
MVYESLISYFSEIAWYLLQYVASLYLTYVYLAIISTGCHQFI